MAILKLVVESDCPSALLPSPKHLELRLET